MLSDDNQRLRELKGLLDDGIITQDEFNAKKAEILKLDVKDVKNEAPKLNNTIKNSKVNNSKNNAPNKGCTIGCLVFFGLIILITTIGLIFTDDAEKKSSNTTQETSTEVTSLKEDLKLLDEKSWNDFKEIYKMYNKVILAMNDPTNMDNYETFKNGYDYFLSKSTELNYGKNSEEREYLSPLVNMCINSQNTCKYTMKYLDSANPSDLSKTKEYMDKVKGAVTTYASNRGMLFNKIGYSQDEINNKVKELENELNK